MTSTYTTSLRLEKQGTGDNSNTWGTRLNSGLIDLLDKSIAGVTSIALLGTTYTLSSNSGAADEARSSALIMTGTGTGSNVIAPTVSKLYIVKNSTSDLTAVSIGMAVGATVSVPSASTLLIWSDGSNCYDLLAADTAVVTLTGTQTLTNKTLTLPIIASISHSGTITVPSGTDTLVGKATTDTLTNKTLTLPVIASISNSGTITVPSGTDTLVGKATTDTLTNKTLSGVTISGTATMSAAAFNEAVAVTIAAATTTDLSAVVSNLIYVTGNSPISITSWGSLANGAMRKVRFIGSGAHTIAQSANTNNLGGTDIVVAQNDHCIIRGLGAGVCIMEAYQRYGALKSSRTVYTTGSGTYTTPTAATRLNIRLVGGGGGGGGGGTSPGAAGTGGTTSFGTPTATGGTGGISNGGGSGGSPSGGDVNISGAPGGNCSSLQFGFGGQGGGTPFGSGGTPGNVGGGGGAAVSSSGAGGGGGANDSSSALACGGGGGGGAYVEKMISGPAATYSYAVGAAGAGGSAGTNGRAGAAGGTGLIIIDEFYT